MSVPRILLFHGKFAADQHKYMFSYRFNRRELHGILPMLSDVELADLDVLFDLPR